MGFWWCCCNGVLIVCTKGCGDIPINLPGVALAIKQGGETIATGSTGDNGCVTFDLPAGSYTIEITSAPTGYTALPTSATVTAGGTTNKTYPLGALSGYACCGDLMLPTTIYLTTPAGTVTMTKGGISYTGSIVVSRSDVTIDNPAWVPGVNAPCLINQTDDVEVQYILSCSGVLNEGWVEGCESLVHHLGPPDWWECINSYSYPPFTHSPASTGGVVGSYNCPDGSGGARAANGSVTMSETGGSGSISGFYCLYPGSVTWTV